MDTSEQYTKMCRKAIEIQIDWQVKPGDFFVTVDGVKTVGMDYIKVGHIEDRVVRFFAFPKNQRVSIESNEFIPKDISFTIGDGVYEIIVLRNCIWLPRQDDLQAMVTIDKSEWFLTGIATYDKYGFSKEIEYYGHFDSFEKMWLCFLMEKKYNKTWDGSNWIVKSESETDG